MEGNFIITGAAEGFGREFSRRVLTRGGRVVMADINQHLGTNTCQHFQQNFGQNCVMFVRTDVTSHDDWERLWSRAKDFLGKIDVLVNNAGVSPSLGFERCMEEYEALSNPITRSSHFRSILVASCSAVVCLRGSRAGPWEDPADSWSTPPPVPPSPTTCSTTGEVLSPVQSPDLITIPSISYQISKHGVATVTRSFGREDSVARTGIKVLTLQSSNFSTLSLAARWTVSLVLSHQDYRRSN